MSVAVVALISVKSDKDEAFRAAAETCITASRQEAGVSRYDLWREAEGEKRYVFNELYSDIGSVQSHMTSDQFMSFAMALQDMVTAPPVILTLNPISVA